MTEPCTHTRAYPFFPPHPPERRTQARASARKAPPRAADSYPFGGTGGNSSITAATSANPLVQHAR